MNKDDILRMARNAGVRDDEYRFEFSEYKYLDRFAALVAAHEREKHNRETNAAWQLMCAKMVADEREECAKVCDAIDHSASSNAPWLCAKRIRERGNP